MFWKEKTDMIKIRFDDNELEIAIVTYNRAKFVQIWLEKCYEPACERNILISVYDSSTNEETYELIESFNKNAKMQINYVRIDSDTTIGYKPMCPILQSQSQYLWLCGDSRYHDFDELDVKAFPFIKQRLDYILLQIVNNAENDGKIYTDLNDFFRECFISVTCVGLSIYKTEMFTDLRNNPELKKKYDDLFKRCYGFAYLGYFYNVFARGSYKAGFAKVKIHNILSKKKVQTWAKRFYGCWIEELCYIMDNIPETYKDKDAVLKETWKKMKLDKPKYCYNARKSGALNDELYMKYKKNGMIDRVLDDDKRIKFYAIAPVKDVERKYKLYSIITFPVKIIRYIKESLKTG